MVYLWVLMWSIDLLLSVMELAVEWWIIFINSLCPNTNSLPSPPLSAVFMMVYLKRLWIEKSQTLYHWLSKWIWWKRCHHDTTHATCSLCCFTRFDPVVLVFILPFWFWYIFVTFLFVEVHLQVCYILQCAIGIWLSIGCASDISLRNFERHGLMLGNESLFSEIRIIWFAMVDLGERTCTWYSLCCCSNELNRCQQYVFQEYARDSCCFGEMKNILEAYPASWESGWGYRMLRSMKYWRYVRVDRSLARGGNIVVQWSPGTIRRTSPTYAI